MSIDARDVPLVHACARCGDTPEHIARLYGVSPDAVRDLLDRPTPPIAQPMAQAAAPSPPVANRTHVNITGKGKGYPPGTGRELFAWARDREQEYEVSLVKFLSQWGSSRGFPGKMITWSPAQAQAAHAEAVRRLDSPGDES